MVKPLIIELPWPPSVNHYWGRIGNRTFISKRGIDFLNDCTEIVKKQKADICISQPMKVEIQAFRPDRRRRDLDNSLKSLLDVLTKTGVIEDDSLIHDLRIYWGEDIKGKVIVKLEVI